ncbi:MULTISPECIES: oligogalacturonate lyase family protein [Olivibacter]|uniref:Oligogalacturonate lyase family protein n=1 Tax=Olivibacter jilunii TaxID=985016 RepID=A0ABW6B5K5_9SPHI|nr:oligogalacturonate lyase family protein [Olivibacter sp. UJ_SKK_5.1]MDX3916765.1 oligogalacturonate lyase family protein [Pseudosphingobacterium sp.]
MKKHLLFFFALLQVAILPAQPLLETGGKEMPDEWVDNVTHHRVMRLVRRPGINLSFYFHNNPFVGNEMVFYGSNERQKESYTGELKNKAQEIYNLNVKDKQLYVVNLENLKVRRLTQESGKIQGEIVHAKSGKVYYQCQDSVFSLAVKTGKKELIFVFPADFKASITTINADASLLGGAYATEEEKEISKRYPEKSQYFNRIYEARLPRTLFTIDIKTRQLQKIFTDSAWLNHVQFSPTDPNLLMFCHEGPWHKVDRIWTINVKTKATPKLIHKRSMDMEIAGHEWFSKNGNYIWYDLQLPRGQTFFVSGTDLKTGKEIKYQLQRNEWSVHYTSAVDDKTFAGDGGDPGSVAKAPDGQYIYLFKPQGDHFEAERLVNMKHHNYKLEPNVHYSPDGKWIIFRANFEGFEGIYAVEIEKARN